MSGKRSKKVKSEKLDGLEKK